MCSVCVCVSVDGEPVICKHSAACSTGGARNAGMLLLGVSAESKLANSLGGSQVSTESSLRPGKSSTESQGLGRDN